MRIVLFVITIIAVFAVAGVAISQTQPESAVKKEPPLKLQFPVDKTYVTQETIKLIGTVSDASIQQVKVSVSGGQPVGDGIVSIAKGAFEIGINLQAGLNEISVAPAGKEADAAKLTLFLKTDENAGETPEGFREYFLHMPTDEKMDCQNCHKLDTTPVTYQRMNVMGASCQTDMCHGDMGKDKYVHGPVGAGVCISCHNPHGSLEKRSVSRSGLSLCLVCHENKENELQQENVHGIISSSGCIDCHDPHESPNKFQLTASTTSELCFACHDDSKSKEAHVHSPVADGDCNVCHNPHASPNKFMLAEDGNDLCFLCHDDIQDELNLPNAHEPVKEDCTNCHDAHGSPNEKLLNSAGSLLCFECHEDTKEYIQTASVQHKPVEDGDCMGCHTPHGSDHTKLLRAEARELCFKCHTEIAELVAKSEYRHGPVQEDDCYACHIPHGSNNPKILSKYFPAEFYNPYDEKQYALCFDCHNEDIALDKFTTTLTDFRNGKRNLHYLHVNKARKGRSCKACHEVHASNQAKHIRTEVPYGKMWSYPIKYTETETGGTCIVGCHKPKNYDRLNPVAYE